MAELNEILNRGIFNQYFGLPEYKAASETADTVGDMRETYGTNTYLKEVCTGAGATKGSGTWKHIMSRNSSGSFIIGDLAAGNYTEIKNNGTFIFRGSSTVWEDDNIDPTNLTGSGNKPALIQFASTTTNISAFSSTQIDEIGTIREIPHYAKLNVGSGTSVFIVFHLHGYPVNANTGNVRCGLEHFFTKEGVAVTTSTIIYITFAVSGVAWAKQSQNFASIPVPNELGSQFHYRFFRDATNAGDTYGSDFAISTIGFHFEADMLGSEEITTK